MDDGWDFYDFCASNNIVIKIEKNIGSTIRGFCYYDGHYYNVVLNNRFSSSTMKATFIHELLHIFENHFSQDHFASEELERKTHLITRTLKTQIEKQHENN